MSDIIDTIRPIPDEMMYYARSDTHYLLYIYDNVRNRLLTSSDRSKPETDLITRALDKSREVSLYRHEHPEFNESTGEGSRGWYNYILKHGHMALNAEQFAVFRALWKWRDTAARRADESPNFILGSNNLGQIARVNPPDMKALHSLLPVSPPIAKSCLNEIWDQIRATKAEGGPSLLQFLTSQAPDSLKKNGVPQAVKASTSWPGIDGEVDVAIRDRSQLFGNMPISSRWEGSRVSSNRQDDYVPFPWQRFVEETSNGDALAESPPEATEEPEVTPAAPEVVEEPDQEFTLKRGKKRKAAPAEEDSSSSEESESKDEDVGVAEDEAMQDVEGGVLNLREDQPKKSKNKKARKAEKRAREQEGEAESEQKSTKSERRALKEQRRQEKKDKKAEGEKQFAAVPFDYSQAASVMNASRSGGGAAVEKTKGKKGKVYDPYAKSVEEGVKGARKAPPIRGERSATFKK